VARPGHIIASRNRGYTDEEHAPACRRRANTGSSSRVWMFTAPPQTDAPLDDNIHDGPPRSRCPAPAPVDRLDGRFERLLLAGQSPPHARRQSSDVVSRKQLPDRARLGARRSPRSRGRRPFHRRLTTISLGPRNPSIRRRPPTRVWQAELSIARPDDLIDCRNRCRANAIAPIAAARPPPARNTSSTPARTPRGQDHSARTGSEASRRQSASLPLPEPAPRA